MKKCYKIGKFNKICSILGLKSGFGLHKEIISSLINGRYSKIWLLGNVILAEIAERAVPLKGELP